MVSSNTWHMAHMTRLKKKGGVDEPNHFFFNLVTSDIRQAFDDAIKWLATHKHYEVVCAMHSTKCKGADSFY